MAEAVDAGLVVRRSVTVALARDDAFRLFTDGMSSWWPLDSHSVYGDKATGVVIEPRLGGRIYETTGDSRTSEWGIVTAWEPGQRLGMRWYPGQDSSQATQVDVSFHDTPQGGTQVDLVHTGWEARREGAAEAAEGYSTGWGFVLGRFVAAA